MAITNVLGVQSVLASAAVSGVVIRGPWTADTGLSKEVPFDASRLHDANKVNLLSTTLGAFCRLEPGERRHLKMKVDDRDLHSLGRYLKRALGTNKGVLSARNAMKLGILELYGLYMKQLEQIAGLDSNVPRDYLLEQIQFCNPIIDAIRDWPDIAKPRTVILDSLVTGQKVPIGI